MHNFLLHMKISSLQHNLLEQRLRRARRVRAPLLYARTRPRLSVFRSNKAIYAQIIDDVKKITLVATSDIKITDKKTKIERAQAVGTHLAELALKKGVREVAFDRGWYKFHGRVKALADAARTAGLQF